MQNRSFLVRDGAPIEYTDSPVPWDEEEDIKDNIEEEQNESIKE